MADERERGNEVLYDRLCGHAIADEYDELLYGSIGCYDNPENNAHDELLYGSIGCYDNPENNAQEERSYYHKRMTGNHEKVLYDRVLGHSVMEEHHRDGGGITPLERDFRDEKEDLVGDYQPPRLPMLLSHGLRNIESTYTGQPYIKHIIPALGKYHVPRIFQSIIEKVDFASDDRSSELFFLAKKIERQCNVMMSRQGVAAKQYIISVVNKVLHTLRKTSIPLFEGISAVLLGSSAENTKIECPDEWDFVIFLPYLRKLFKDYFPIGNGSAKFSCTEDMAWDIKRMLLEYTHIPGSYHTWTLTVLRQFVVKIFRSVLLLEPECMFGHKALALTYTYDGIISKMDISFGVRDESKVLSNDSTMLVLPLEDQPPYGFYIWADSDFSPTSTFDEVSKMRSFSYNTRLCYQISKYLISKCIPVYFSEKCTCDKTIFPSYHLKSILFFMIEYYDNQSFWCEEQMTNRIMEIFVIYGICLYFGNISNPLAMSKKVSTIGIGKYMHICKIVQENRSRLNGYISQENVLQCIRNLRCLAECNQIKYFSDIFTEEKVFDGDIIVEICSTLATLKSAKGDSTSTLYPSIHRFRENTEEETPEEENIGKTLDNADGGFILHRYITTKSEVASMIISPDHDDELLIATQFPSCLVKYRNNEIVQDIVFDKYDRVPIGMFYCNGLVTIAFSHCLGAVYNYMDLTKRSRFNHGVVWKAIAKLPNNSFLCLTFRNKFVKMNGNRPEECYSLSGRFKEPSHVMEIKSQDTVGVAVSDLFDSSITGLSSDLSSVIFVFRAPILKLIEHLMWNDETASISVCHKNGILQISGSGAFVRNFENLTYMRKSVYIHKRAAMLTIGGEAKNKIMVYTYR